MNYKHILQKKSGLLISLILFILLVIFLLKWIDYQKYKMYVNVMIEDETQIIDPSSPWVTTWFNAKKWLNQNKYIRVDADKEYIIDSEGVIFPLNSSNQEIFLNRLYNSMYYFYPKLKKQSLNEFSSNLQSLNFEYIFSRFNQSITKPCIHSYLVSFDYKEQHFETIMDWDEEKMR